MAEGQKKKLELSVEEPAPRKLRGMAVKGFSFAQEPSDYHRKGKHVFTPIRFGRLKPVDGYGDPWGIQQPESTKAVPMPTQRYQEKSTGLFIGPKRRVTEGRKIPEEISLLFERET